jgi:hypothetical protein
MAEKDAASVLEEAADLLLVRGVLRGEFGMDVNGPRCAMGALAEVQGVDLADVFRLDPGTAMFALDVHVRRDPMWDGLFPAGTHTPIPSWNDDTKDDFEVIDTLRLVAKDLRNGAS